ncbi:MAG: aminoacyl-tRNA hydrolase [Rubrivivax sp.]|nr:aminoacyl-tRNA hydrolase [Rubrivivax sp.]
MKPPRLTEAEGEWSAIRAQGAGGQNVNKVSNAAQLRFDIRASRLPEAVQQRLLAQADQRISGDGVIVIKAQDHRSLPRNRREALARLQALVDAAATVPRRRVATQPTFGSRQRRLQAKQQRGQVKASRGRVSE